MIFRMAAASRFFEGAEGLVFPLPFCNSVNRVNTEQSVLAIRVEGKTARDRAAEIFRADSGILLPAFRHPRICPIPARKKFGRCAHAGWSRRRISRRHPGPRT